MKVEKISKAYNGTRVLNDFSADFPKGEISCIMGRSGCGKTTLLNIIMGLVPPDSGSFDAPGKISVVFQEDRLCERLSAAANVKLVCQKDYPEEKIIAALAAVGLGREDIFRPVSELSGGMKRRTAIVRAMSAESNTIIMDEALKGLDDATKKLTTEYILSNRGGRTLIFVTHDINEVELLGGVLVNMDKNQA